MSELEALHLNTKRSVADTAKEQYVHVLKLVVRDMFFDTIYNVKIAVMDEVDDETQNS